MKRTLTSVILASSATMLAVGCACNQAMSRSCACVVPAGAATSVNETTADALRETLTDERRVQAFYNGVTAKHGQQPPFSHIVHAEERHAAVVASLMTRHGVAVPTVTPANVPAVPGTIAECCRVAAQLERENIAMYDRLLASASEPDIRAAFENLRAASKNNHLPAFERRSANAGSSAATRTMSFGYGRVAGKSGMGACGGSCLVAR